MKFAMFFFKITACSEHCRNPGDGQKDKQDALNKIKRLKIILPICSHHKKNWND